MKSFAALTFLLALATASPIEVVSRDMDEASAALAKRDTEIVYLSNCVHATSCCNGDTYTSGIFYYPASGQSGSAPAASNQCTVTTDNYAWWEQDGRQCSFSTGVTFTTHIDSDAQSRPLYSWSGWGTNGYKNFNCYRDNGHKLFATSGPEWANTCSSVYYCLPQ
ncbi:hypothetical protein C8A00DRAFT_17900 [Chaetomidium leptoderma]|uniref:Uncharacterized protein n=1 Tax=Chaetomidium leptoderma TaxID=669021 RepID=A0AAN6ZVQ2_9PEZI|nr:hypothetical protein C8A00DRAFT_17900 [Chaetomidium leptoderma]